MPIASHGRFARALTALAAGVCLTAPVAGQSLPQQNQEILNELRAIRQLLEKLAGPLGARPGLPATGALATAENVKLAAVTGQVLGKPDAPLTIVEFTDLQCPFCRQYDMTTFGQIKKEYIDTGKLRYISRDLPLEALHPLAMPAARAARCAAEQGKFWEMRHTILVNNQKLTAEVFRTFAQDLKLNVNAFNSCASNATKFEGDIRKDIADAASVGITGTPSFVIGRTTGSGLDGVRLVGAQPFAAFDAKLKDLLLR